jgi:energy-converting hydrogenase A subunit R
MKRIFDTDCEGPISKNDNAFEIAQRFIPDGGKFFAKLSKYDDLLADIDKKHGYKAGDTLRLILPFLKAYGVTDSIIQEYSEQNILIVPGADVALRHINSFMSVFIISTSYRPYINSLCDAIGFPVQNTFCTEVSLDKYEIPDSEIRYLKELHDEILKLPEIDIPASAHKREDLDSGTIKCTERLDQIFWNEFNVMVSKKMLDEVNPIGGFEKANAIRKSCDIIETKLSEVMYAGDSITDADAMKLVSESDGVAISFNGNRYAIQSADIACTSPNALILAGLALLFNDYGTAAVRELASEWDRRKYEFENNINKMIPVTFRRATEEQNFMVKDVTLNLIEESNIQELISKSESFRKTVRGESIGKLG